VARHCSRSPLWSLASLSEAGQQNLVEDPRLDLTQADRMLSFEEVENRQQYSAEVKLVILLFWRLVLSPESF
jgi:hypothetical protein